MKTFLTSIFFLLQVFVNTGNPQPKVKDSTKQVQVIPTDTSVPKAATSPALDKSKAILETSTANNISFSKDLSQEIKEKNYWKTRCLAGERQIDYLTSLPPRRDTIERWNTPLVTRTIYKGLIPIPGTNKKKVQQAKDLFIEVQKVEDDTTGVQISYARH